MLSLTCSEKCFFQSENRDRKAGVLRGIFEKLDKTISEVEIILKKYAL